MAKRKKKSSNQLYQCTKTTTDRCGVVLGFKEEPQTPICICGSPMVPYTPEDRLKEETG